MYIILTKTLQLKLIEIKPLYAEIWSHNWAGSGITLGRWWRWGKTVLVALLKTFVDHVCRISSAKWLRYLRTLGIPVLDWYLTFPYKLILGLLNLSVKVFMWRSLLLRDSRLSSPIPSWSSQTSLRWSQEMWDQ